MGSNYPEACKAYFAAKSNYLSLLKEAQDARIKEENESGAADKESLEDECNRLLKERMERMWPFLKTPKSPEDEATTTLDPDMEPPTEDSMKATAELMAKMKKLKVQGGK
jgi:hypothetical protein